MSLYSIDCLVPSHSRSLFEGILELIRKLKQRRFSATHVDFSNSWAVVSPKYSSSIVSTSVMKLSNTDFIGNSPHFRWTRLSKKRLCLHSLIIKESGAKGVIGTAEKASFHKQQFDSHKPVKTDIQETLVNFVCLYVVLEPNNFPFFIKDLNFTTP